MRIALYEPDIPQNAGNIFRLGACLGVSVDVIEPAGFVINDKKFKRSAMDYINHLNYKKHENWNAFYKWAINKKYRIVLLTTKSSKSYINFTFYKSDILLFGRESAGVPDFIHDLVDNRLTIPMQPEARSLNLSSSVALVIGEALRQINLIN